jgi:maltoporin
MQQRSWRRRSRSVYAAILLAGGARPVAAQHADTIPTRAQGAPVLSDTGFRFHGYLRSGFGVDGTGKGQQPFIAPLAGSKYRFYDRYDVHITDFWFRDPSGFGGGVEDMSLGRRAKLAVAWIGGTQDQLDPNGTVPPEDLFRFNKNTLDLRLYSLSVGRGVASIAIDLSQFKGDEVTNTGGAPIKVDDSFGASATGMLDWPFKEGRNRLVVQYGKGAAYDFRSILTTPVGRTFSPGETVRFDDVWQFRVLNDFLVNQRGPWALQAFTLYQELENGAASDSRIRWVSLGARPVRQLGRFFSLATEVGWDYTVQGDQPGGSLLKLTVAPQITPAMTFLSRPSLRAFATWAHWSDEFRGRIAAATNPNAVRGSAIGVQIETWW